jgi:hypothetical protein
MRLDILTCDLDATGWLERADKPGLSGRRGAERANHSCALPELQKSFGCQLCLLQFTTTKTAATLYLYVFLNHKQITPASVLGCRNYDYDVLCPLTWGFFIELLL